MDKKPVCMQTTTIAKSKLFTIEALDLHFSNGKKCIYERVRPNSPAAVLIIPLIDNNTVLLIREYAAGIEQYELALPKGIWEQGEDATQAANRELMEEVGYGANNLQPLKSISTAPGYFSATTQLVLATDLYEKNLPGDEPETPEVIPWDIQELDHLIAREDMSEARTIAALYMVRDMINRGEINAKS